MGDAAPGAVIGAGLGAEEPQWVVPTCGVHGGHCPSLCRRSHGKVSQLTSDTETQR